nr:unnamed protein product [Callosobruchus chinensis]
MDIPVCIGFPSLNKYVFCIEPPVDMQSTPVALPLLQGLVTIFTLSSAPFAEADVSHVLRGEARPPPHHAATDPREVNSLTADAGDYWWMADDSPFRAAYDEYKKCSEKGNCLHGGSKAFAAGGSVGVSANANLPPIDIKKNPFLNGAIQSNSLAHGQGSKVEGGGHAFHSGASIDISKNPFLNGEFVAGNGDKIHDENGFIGVQPKKPGFATSHPLASNKPGFSTSFPVGQQAIVLNGSSSAFGSGSSGFGAARGQTHQGGLQHSEQGPSQPDFGQAARSGSVACTVKNHACVPKHLCVNGVVNGNTENLLSGSYCNPETEVCCQLSGQRNSENAYNQLPNLSQKTAHPTSINDLISSEKKPSSGSSIKFAGANGSSPITIQVIGGENEDRKTQYTSGSSIRPSTLKPTREVNSNENSIFGSPVDYSNVHFDSNVRFASTIQGPEYLPPLEGTTPSISTYQPSIPTTPRPVSCPPGTQRTLGGLCESTQLPECPPGTIRKPDNSCAKPACPYGYEQQPDGSCKRLQPPTTPQTPTTPSCPPGTYSIGGGRCSSPSSPVSSCPPGTLRRPDGSCGPRTGPTPTPCPPGTHLTALGECAPDTQKSVCPFGAVRLPDGTCQTTSSPRPCPPGTFLTTSGSCAPSSTPTTPAPSCPPGTIQQPDGSCQRRITPLPTCPPGTFRGPSGECRTQPTPLPGCPIGSTRQPDGSCQRTCPPGLHPQSNGECRGPSTPSPTSRCPAGTIQQPDGSCHRPSSPSPSCPPGSYPGPNGECRGPSTPSPTSRCPAGTIQQPDGSCQRPSSPSPSCLPGSYPGPNGECRGPSTPSPTSRCPAGTIQQPDGSCQRPSSPSPSCPPGSYPSPNGECRGPSTPSPTPRCPAGTIQQPDRSCQRPSSPSPSCPPGSYPGPNGECRGPSTPSPTPRCPAGTVQQPDGSCQRPQLPCPPGTYQGYNGECKRRTTPAPRCPIGTTQQPDGSCQKPVTPGPVCPAGTSQQPDGSCQRPISPTSCPPNTYLGSSGSCEPVRAVTTTGPPAYEYPRPCPPGTVKSATGTCEALPSSPRPACPTGTRSTPFGTCEPIFSATTPKPPPRPFERPTTPELNKDYLPPKPTSQYVPSITTHRPHQTSATTEHRTSFTSPTQHPPFSTPRPFTAITKPSCSQGQILSSNGVCIYPQTPANVPAIRPCPSGTKLSPFTNECVKSPSGFTTSYEYQKPTTPIRPTSPTRPQCGLGKVLSPSGICVQSTEPICKPGEIQSSSGKCVYQKAPELSTVKPSCPTGQVPAASGFGCEFPGVSTKTPSCPTGTKLNSFTKQCDKTPGASTGYEYPRPTTESTPKPSCRFGQVLSASGECVYPASSTPRPPFGPTTGKYCPPGQAPSSSGFGCEYPSTPVPSCPPGTKLSPFTKKCVPGTPTGYEYQKPATAISERPKPTIKPGTQCSLGQSLSPTGQCITELGSTPRPPCGVGQVLSATGICVSDITSTYRPTFGPSTSRPHCPSGQVPTVSGTGCEYPRGPALAQSCPPGTRLSPVSNKCEKTVGVTTGYEYPRPSTPFSETPRPTISPRPQCGPGQSLSPSGICVSPFRPGSPTTRPSTAKPCPPGQVSSASGYGCEYPKISTQLPTCSPGTNLNRFTNKCEKTPNASTGYEYPRPTTPSKPQCSPGETLSPTGKCIPKQLYGPSSTAKPSCKFGQVLSASGECIYASSTTPRPSFGPTSAKPCPPGQVPSTSGYGCEYPRTPVPTCPPNTKLSPFTKECVPVTATGYEYQTPTTVAAKRPKPAAQCGPGQSLSSTGQCVIESVSTPRPSCGPGRLLSASGACVYETAVTSRPTSGTSTSRPSCPPGQAPSRSGSGCEYPKGPPVEQSCPLGTRLSSFSNKCEKIPGITPGYEYPKPSTAFTERPRTTVSPKPQCGPGQSLSPSGQCVFPSRPGSTTTGPSVSKLCPPGQVPSTSGDSCEYPKVSTTPPTCPSDTKLNSFTKQCEKIPEASTGYEYPRPTSQSKFQCRPGQSLSPTGQCITEYGSTPKPFCGPGQVASASGACVYQAIPTSRPTYESSTSGAPCPQGQIPTKSGSGCEFPSRPVPAQSCPPGTRLSPFSNKCEKTVGVTTGYEYPKPSTPFPKTPRPTVSSSSQCGPGQSLSPSGRCISPSRPVSPTSGQFTPKPCPPGQVPSASGYGCEYPKLSTLPSTCPPDSERNLFTKKCDKITKASTGYEYPRPTTSSKPQCNPGETLSPTGHCITEFGSTPRPSCGSGQVLSSSGACVYQTTVTSRPAYEPSTSRPPCPPGQVPSRSRSGCEYPEGPTGVTTGYEYPKPSTAFTEGQRPTVSSRPQCGPGQSLSPSGQCGFPSRPGSPTTPKPCPPGQVPSASGYGCEYPKISTLPPACPTGTKLNRFTKQCDKTPEASTGYEYPRPTVPSKPQCSPGERLSPSGNCIPIRPYGPSSTPKPSCELNQVLSSSGECIYPSSSTARPPFVPTTAKPCPPGQVRSKSGFGCEYPRTPVPSCPSGTKLSPFTKECIPSTSTGYEYQKPAVKPGSQCGPGQSLSPTGQCVTESLSTPKPSCGPGRVLTASGTCVYQTAATSRPTFGTTTSRPSCPPGQLPSRSGSGCEYPEGPAVVQSCPPGERLSSFSNKCEKIPGVTAGYEYQKPTTAFNEQPRPTVSLKPQCGPGQSLSPSGQCVFPSRPGSVPTGPPIPKRCPPGQVPSASGYNCEYPKVSTPPSTCPPGTTLNPFTKQCAKTPETSTGYEYPRPTSPSKPQCGPEETLSPSGYCIPLKPYGPSSTQKPACRFGQILSASGECVHPASSTTRPPFGPTTAKPCPPGQVTSKSGFGCEYPRTPVPSCPPGTKLSSFTKECVPSTPTGYEYQKPTVATVERPKPIKPGYQCSPGQSLSPTGQCITEFGSTPRPSCGPGQVLSSSGDCVYQTTVTSRPAYGPSTSSPPCPPGQVPSRSRSGCEYPEGPAAAQSCPPGTRLSSFSNKCEKTASVTTGYEYPKPTTAFTEGPRPTVSPGPQCGPGQSLSPTGQCAFPSRPGSPTTSRPKPCPPGQVPSASGYGCEYPKVSTPPPTCPTGSKLNRFTKQCDKTPEASTGYEYPRPTAPSKPQCSPGETYSPSGNCIPIRPYGPSTTPKLSCGFGQVLSSSGECMYPSSSTARPPFVPTTAKPCPPGQVASTSGFGCEYPRTPVPSCPPGIKLSPFTKECAPSTPTGYEYQKPTTAVYERPKPTVKPGFQCGPGQSLSPTGQCVTELVSTPKPSCQAGQVPSPSGSGCVYPRGPVAVQSCPPGTKYSSLLNKCEKTPEPTPGYEYPKPSTAFPEQPRPTVFPRPQCVPGQSLSPAGQCVFPGLSTTESSTQKTCPVGQVPSTSGYGCEYPKVSTSSPTCPPGTKLNQFTKQCDKTSEVTTGYQYPRPTAPSKPSKCSSGETLSPSGNCVPIKPYSPSSTSKPSCRFGQVLSASGECVYPASSTSIPPFGPTTAKPCPPGQVPSTSGFGCEYPRTPVPSCAPGTKLSPFTKECIPETPTGYEYQTPTTAAAERPKPTVKPGAQCSPGQTLTPRGQCVTLCRNGQVLTASGDCVDQTVATTRPTFGSSTSRPSCPPGQVPSRSGSGCEYPEGPTVAQSCPPGTKFSYISNKCEKTSGVTTGYEYPKPSTPFTEGSRPTVSPRPQCGPGQSLSPSGQCIFPSRPGSPTILPSKPCPPGQVPSASGYSCEYPKVSTPPPTCPPGTKLNRFTKQCDRTPEASTTPPQTQCGIGEILTPAGICGPLRPYSPSSTPKPSCRPGQVLSASGECVYPASSTSRPPFGPTTKPCPPGQVPSSSGFGCEYPRTPVPTCRPGTKLSPLTNECIQVTSTAQCGPGQSLSSTGKCISISVSTSRPSSTGFEYQKPTTVSLERPQSTFVTLCKPGESLSPSGQCVTPSGGKFTTSSTSTGYQYPKPTTPFSDTVRPTSRPRCGQGQVLSPSGRCVSPSIESYRPQPSSTVKPVCGPGQIVSDAGICAYPAKPSFGSSTPRVCPTGYENQRPSTSYSPERVRPTSKPQCAPGESLSPSGQCVSPSTSRPSYVASTPKSCPPGQTPSASGIGCEYLKESVPTTFRPTEYELGRPTTTRPEQPQSTSRPLCAPGKSLSPSGQCITPTGVRRPSYESSTPGSTFESSTPRSCPPGQVLSASGFDCEYPKAPRPTTYRPSISTGYDYKKPTTPFPERSHVTSRPLCAPGESLSPSGQCVTPSGVTSRPTCGPGQVLTPSGNCVSRQTTSKPTFESSTSTPCPPGQIPSTSGFGCEIPNRASTFRPSFGPSTVKPCPPNQIPSKSGVGCEYPERGRPSKYFPESTTPFPERQQPTTTPSTATSTRPCPPGQVPSSSGIGCEYPKVPRPTTYRPGISTGYQYPKPTQPFQESFKPTPPSRCGPGQILSASGICSYPSGPLACSPGQTLSPSGECVDKSITTYKPSFGIPTTKPSCPPGQVPSTSGVGCEYPRGPTACRPDQILSPAGECIDRNISTFRPSSRPPTTKPSCPPGQVPSLSGVGCEYPRGVTPSRPLACKPGQTLSPSGVCLNQTVSTYKPSFGSSCPPGQVPSATGVGCEYPQGPSQGPSVCPPGQILSSSGSCIPVSQKPCPPGQTRSRSGICIQTTLHPHTVNHFTTTSPKARPTAKPSGGYNYETPTPTFGYPSSPLDSSQNNIYGQYASPSEGPDNTVDSANANSFFVPTTRQPVTAPQPTYSRQPTFNGGQQPIEETSPPVGCAAALKCVQEIYCTADGFVSPVPVVLTKEQETLRVPTTTCKDIETGIIGKCCRDPNYKDPWPSANLVNGVDDGQYKEDNFYGQRELTSNRLTRASNLTGSPVIPPALRRSRTQEASSANCGTRNLVSLYSLDTNDVLAKGGEWKLGIDEEPLPFQIVKVGAIIRHPEYKPGSYHNDVAILVLREKLRFTKNIGPLCLSQTKEISPNSKCKLTGWGKRILQLHARGAIMHHIDVNVVDNQKCQQQLSERFKESLPNYSPNMLCGQSNIDHCKNISEQKLNAFSIGTMGQRILTRKELEEQRKREEETATAHVFEEFLETFQEAPINRCSKVWVKAGTYDAGARKEDTKDAGKLYKPTSRIAPTVETCSSIERAYKYAKLLASDEKLERLGKKKSQAKNNLEAFKEELIQIQEERELQQSKGDIGSLDNGEPPGTELYLGNLNPEITEQQLAKIFGRFGPLRSIRVARPRSEEEKAMGRRYGYGFVSYMARKDGERAWEALNGKDILGYNLKLNWSYRSFNIPPHPIHIPPHPIYIPPALLDPPQPPPQSGLPFNAQPMAKDKNVRPKSQEELNEILSRAVVKVVIPQDRNLRMLIHRMVEFVVRAGPTFEAVIMKREIDNPKFSQRDRLEHLIRGLTPEKNKIGEAMVFCIEHSEAAQEIAECITESLSNESTALNKKIARLYLVSDILHNCQVKEPNEIPQQEGDYDGIPIEAPDSDIDGVPLDGSALRSAMMNYESSGSIEDGSDIDEDGQPKAPLSGFNTSKWEAVGPDQVEAQAVTTSKSDMLENQDSSQESSANKKDNSVDYSDTRNMTEHKRKKLREIEVKVVQYQDELESGQQQLKSGWTLPQMVEQYRRMLLGKLEKKEKSDKYSKEKHKRKDMSIVRRERRVVVDSSDDESYYKEVSESRSPSSSRNRRWKAMTSPSPPRIRQSRYSRRRDSGSASGSPKRHAPYPPRSSKHTRRSTSSRSGDSSSSSNSSRSRYRSPDPKDRTSSNLISKIRDYSYDINSNM